MDLLARCPPGTCRCRLPSGVWVGGICGMADDTTRQSELDAFIERKANRFMSLAEAKATLDMIERLLEPIEHHEHPIQRFYLDAPA